MSAAHVAAAFSVMVLEASKIEYKPRLVFQHFMSPNLRLRSLAIIFGAPQKLLDPISI
jgi:hypothetical protein